MLSVLDRNWFYSAKRFKVIDILFIACQPFNTPRDLYAVPRW